MTRNHLPIFHRCVCACVCVCVYVSACVRAHTHAHAHTHTHMTTHMLKERELSDEHISHTHTHPLAVLKDWAREQTRPSKTSLAAPLTATRQPPSTLHCPPPFSFHTLFHTTSKILLSWHLRSSGPSVCSGDHQQERMVKVKRTDCLKRNLGAEGKGHVGVIHQLCVCVHACVCACACVRVCVCERERVRARLCVHGVGVCVRVCRVILDVFDFITNKR